MIVSGRDRVWLGVAAISLLTIAFSLFSPSIASASQITSRSLTLEAGVSDGGSDPGGVVNHYFAFTVATTANIGSIQFLYCTTADGTCTTPTGLDTTGATLGTQSGSTFSSLVTTTNGSPYLSRVSATSITTGTALTYQLLGVTNPTTYNQAFYVRISTYASTDTSGSPIDQGNVSASTASPIVLSGVMPESLIFCTGATISETGGVPDCSTATSGDISFNQLFSPTDTATATSQMAASTNAGSGYSITVNGTTLTSGSNTITALATATASSVGTRQFGMNLMANTTATSTPAIGADITPSSNATNYRGQALTGYSTIDNFQFNSGDSVANSGDGGEGPTDAQIYTASYIANVSGSQPAGTYTTTLTYICTPTF